MFVTSRDGLKIHYQVEGDPAKPALTLVHGFYGSMQDWYEACGRAGVPCGPINNFEHVFADPQIVHRQMRMQLPHPTIGELPQVANPVRFSATPIAYDRAPPLLGQHTLDILSELGYDPGAIAALKSEGAI